MIDYRFRLWLIKQVATLVVPPAATTVIGVKVTCSVAGLAPPGQPLLFIISLLSIPLCSLAYLWLIQLSDEKKARQAGCQQAPLLKGKGFLSLDLAKRYVF